MYCWGCLCCAVLDKIKEFCFEATFLTQLRLFTRSHMTAVHCPYSKIL